MIGFERQVFLLTQLKHHFAHFGTQYLGIGSPKAPDFGYAKVRSFGLRPKCTTIGNMERQFPLAIVTGAAHRLGRAFALALARRGYAILLHYFGSEFHAEQTSFEIRALGVPAFPVRANLTDAQQVDELFSALDALLADPASNLSGLRVLVNSAAIMRPGDIRSISASDWDDVFALNLRAPFLCAQKAYQRMEAGGLIVNISDIAAHQVWTRFSAYTVSKAGLESLTKIMARVFAPSVRVNSIAPGLVLPSDDTPPEEWSRLVGRLPLQRAAYIEEITHSLEFLLENEYITGQAITVDGGYSLL
jgi:NAD(P)-dependent dehydrogenase (short-subunit alcohol dehydrogenase family)